MDRFSTKTAIQSSLFILRPSRTFSLDRSNIKRLDCIIVLFENLFKLKVLDGRRVKRLDCIAVVVENLSKLKVLDGRRAQNL